MPRITKAVIPAAGFGTRFLPATKAQPKEMLAIVDKPVIQYVVEEAVASGIKDIIIITGQSKRAIEDHFDRSFELEMHLKEKHKRQSLKEVQRLSKLANFIYVRQKEILGDGHAILQAYSLLKNEPFAYMLGDEIIDSPTPNLAKTIALYEEFLAPIITVTKIPRRDVSHYGIIGGQRIRPGLHRITKFIEKPKAAAAPSLLANIGRCVVTPELMATLKNLRRKQGSELRLADAFEPYRRKHPMYAHVHEGRRYDCGNKLGFLQATVEFAIRHSEVSKPFSRYLKTI